MLNIKKLAMVSALCLAALASNIAHAAIVQFSVNGEITRATTNNYFDLIVGDIITLTGEFDDSPVALGEILIDFSLNTNNFNLTFGNTIYTDQDDIDNLAAMYLFDGVFDGLDFITSDGKLDSTGFAGNIDPTTGVLYDDFITSNNNIGGRWIVDSFQITPVPVPAALWLFGSGLVFLGGVARNRKK